MLYERLGEYELCRQSVRLAIEIARIDKDLRGTFELCMLANRNEQRARELTTARKYATRAFAAARKLKEWGLAAEAGVEVVRIIRRLEKQDTPVHLPARWLGWVTERYRDLVSAKPPASLHPETIYRRNIVPEPSVILRILTEWRLWSDESVLSMGELQSISETLEGLASSETGLGQLTQTLFGRVYREIGGLDGVPSVKAFDVLVFAENTWKVEALREFLIMSSPSPLPAKPAIRH
jgi:hypothetical protein